MAVYRTHGREISLVLGDQRLTVGLKINGCD